jgi:hypothetical protein
LLDQENCRKYIKCIEISTSESIYFLKEKNFRCALFESQGGGKKGSTKGRDENPIIYLTTILEAERNFSDVYKRDIMMDVYFIVID